MNILKLSLLLSLLCLYVAYIDGGHCKATGSFCLNSRTFCSKECVPVVFELGGCK